MGLTLRIPGNPELPKRSDVRGEGLVKFGEIEIFLRDAEQFASLYRHRADAPESVRIRLEDGAAEFSDR